MKKLLSAVIGCGLCTVFFACNNSGNKADSQLTDSTDSLELLAAEAQRDSLMSLIGEISQNVLEINRMENILASPGFSQETPAQKQEIIANIDAMRIELENRRKQLEALEARLKDSGSFSARLQKTVDSQKALITAQSQKILDMQQQLNIASTKIKKLSTDIDSLNTRVNAVTEQKKAAEQRTEALSSELNVCYYVVGSNDELKEHGILEKKFLRKTKVLEKDFDRSFFTKADKRTLREIPTYSKKAKVHTKQPANSYKIEEADGLKVIKITNPALFWEKSDFLVIEAK